MLKAIPKSYNHHGSLKCISDNDQKPKFVIQGNEKGFAFSI